MPLADFVHLHVHTAYSLSAGAILIKELVALCQKHRMPAVAVADTGNLFGALEVAMTCAAAGIQPIIGCETALERHGAQEANRRRPREICKSQFSRFEGPHAKTIEPDGTHLV